MDVGFLGLEHIIAQDSWKFYSSKITYCILILYHLLKGKQRWCRNLLPCSFLILFVPHQTRATDSRQSENSVRTLAIVFVSYDVNINKQNKTETPNNHYGNALSLVKTLTP